LVVGCSLPG